MLYSCRCKFFLLLFSFALVTSINIDLESAEYLTEEENRDFRDLKDATLLTDFFADSKLQLVIDLDFLWDIFYSTPQKLKVETQSGNDSFGTQLLKYLEELQNYDISAPCLADIGHFLWSSVKYAIWLNELSCQNCSCSLRSPSENQWIFNVIDAFGKPPAGVLSGNNLWIGSWSECRKINVIKNRQGQKWSGQYCMASFQPYNRDNPLKSIGSSGAEEPWNLCCTKLEFLFNLSLRISRSKSGINESRATDGTDMDPDADKCFDLVPLLNYGLCTPDTCTNYDVKKIIDIVYQLAEKAIGRKVVCNVDVVCSNNRPESRIINDTSTLLVLFFFLTVVTVMVFGTLYDYIVYQQLLQSLIPPDTAQNFYKNQNWFIKFLLAFSIYTNGKNVLRTERSSKQIHCLHGIRVMSMFWIILGHSYYYMVTSFTMDNLLPSLISFPQKLFNLLVVQAPLAVDTFFFLSGMLTCYIGLQKLTDLATKRKTVMLPDFWSLFYIHRYLRLTPIYFMVMLMEVTIFTYVAEGPFWRPIERNYCRDSWWANMIYLNNFILQDSTCMGWTWYLAIDMQFHVFAPIFLLLFFRSKIAGLRACTLTILLSSAINLFTVLSNGYPPAPLLTAKLQIVKDLQPYWENVYVKPYIRCIPYVAGLIVGYFLNHRSSKVEFKKKYVAVAWILSSVFGLWSIFGLFPYARTGEISTFTYVAYVLFGRSCYSLSLAWITYACASGYGGPVNTILSWKGWIPLSRITFSAYLIHPILIQIYHFSRPHPFHFTGTYQMIYLFAVAVFVAYFVGFLISLAFEIPLSILENLIVNHLIDSVSKTRRKPVEAAPTSNDEKHEKLLQQPKGSNDLQ
uniref:NRF domain-containing protein n=1 Tax=Syphacia muris TaxID=451379 RepID=A0A0N5AGU8_9BILA